VPTEAAELDLTHHGDVDATAGMLDFAVNVHGDGPPPWLAEALRDAVDGLGRYPDATPARDALAALHGIPPECVLPTAGAAEAFTLVAAQPWRRPVVVHPQFTEPEVALTRHGHRVERVLLAPPAFGLGGAEVPTDADLVVVGNPTNPTSVLHDPTPLLGPGRTLVVDEAFMDVVEPASSPRHSLVRRAARTPGLLVVRSLTKTFAVPGLRLGYAVGTPDLLVRLASCQPHWAVGSLAVAAAVACAGEDGTAHADAVRAGLPGQREHLVAVLADAGFEVAPAPAGPFVLARHDAADTVRRRLRDHGIALRRGDTFPGLGPDWVRVAVRDRPAVDRLRTALAEAVTPPEESP